MYENTLVHIEFTFNSVIKHTQFCSPECKVWNSFTSQRLIHVYELSIEEYYTDK